MRGLTFSIRAAIEGRNRRTEPEGRTELEPHGELDRHDRQVRAFGPAGQRRIRQLTVAIVGVGGAGSLLAQGLAHLGVGRLILFDPDTVEQTNLNRLVGAEPLHAKLHTPKVAVAAAMVARIDPGVAVLPVQANVLNPDTWLELRCADIVIGAVDGHAARWALNALAIQYLRTYIDVGVEVTTETDRRLEVAGHVATVTADGPCLLCLAGYDPRQVHAETDPSLAQTKRRAGYLADAPDVAAPAVIFLNQAVTALALGEVVNQAAAWRPVHPYVLVDLAVPATTLIHADRDLDCPACGPTSARGLGDAAGVPMRPATAPFPLSGGDIDGDDT